MAKIKNKSLYSDNKEYLLWLAHELDFLGRPYRLDLENGVITQIARRPKKVKKKKGKKDARNKRAESAARNER